MGSWTAEHGPSRSCFKASARWVHGHCCFIPRDWVWLTSPLCLDASTRRLSPFLPTLSIQLKATALSLYLASRPSRRTQGQPWRLRHRTPSPLWNPSYRANRDLGPRNALRYGG